MISESASSHCSSHEYFSCGCGDCAVAELYRLERETKLNKAARIGIHELVINTGRPDPKVQIVKNQLARKLYIFLTNAAHDVIKAVKKKVDSLEKASEAELLVEMLAVAAFSSIDWIGLVKEVANELSIAMHSGGIEGLAQLEIKDEAEYDKVATLADGYAQLRAAEMVGMKWESEKLVVNSNAKFAISETTRDDLRDTIELAVQKNQSVEQLSKQIQSLGTFSKSRAELIAKTEIAMAQFKGNFDVWKSSGLVKMVNVELSHNHSVTDVCDLVNADNPYHINHAPTLPIHPRCECIMTVDSLEE